MSSAPPLPRPRQLTPAPALQGPLRTPCPLQVLVVDDNADAADTLALLVSSWGYRSAVAYDGLAGLEMAATFQPDAVLTDIGLPGMDGWELARRLRRLPGREGVLLVAITSYGDDDARRRSWEAGIDQHLVKPVDPDTLRPLLASRARRCEGPG